jgi:superfamily II DNA or RNA helicase
LRDERFGGEPLDVSFVGTLRPDQEAAVAAMLRHDNGILCAPTAFGKTVTAAALIARRGVNTLVLVHRTELLKQWQERLQAFLGVGKGVIGAIGGGKAKPTGKIDIAVMQSLSRKGEANEIVENYGQVIADECHHLSAFSFETILKRVRAKHVLGLTATPIRRDGRQPIIFMQCGPTRHTAAKPAGAPQTLEVIPRYLAARIQPPRSAAVWISMCLLRARYVPAAPAGRRNRQVSLVDERSGRSELRTSETFRGGAQGRYRFGSAGCRPSRQIPCTSGSQRGRWDKEQGAVASQ